MVVQSDGLFLPVETEGREHSSNPTKTIINYQNQYKIKSNLTEILSPEPQTCIQKAICPHVWCGVWGVGAGMVHSQTAGENRVCSGC